MSLLGLLWRYLAVMAFSVAVVLVPPWRRICCWALDICPECEQTTPWHAPSCCRRKESGWQDRAMAKGGLRGPC